MLAGSSKYYDPERRERARMGIFWHSIAAVHVALWKTEKKTQRNETENREPSYTRRSRRCAVRIERKRMAKRLR